MKLQMSFLFNLFLFNDTTGKIQTWYQDQKTLHLIQKNCTPSLLMGLCCGFGPSLALYSLTIINKSCLFSSFFWSDLHPYWIFWTWFFIFEYISCGKQCVGFLVFPFYGVEIGCLSIKSKSSSPIPNPSILAMSPLFSLGFGTSCCFNHE